MSQKRKGEDQENEDACGLCGQQTTRGNRIIMLGENLVGRYPEAHQFVTVYIHLEITSKFCCTRCCKRMESFQKLIDDLQGLWGHRLRKVEIEEKNVKGEEG